MDDITIRKEMCIMIPHSKYTVLNQNKSFGLNVIENKFQMFSFFLVEHIVGTPKIFKV